MWPTDSVQSHQPTATEHTGLHHGGPAETRLLRRTLSLDLTLFHDKFNMI